MPLKQYIRFLYVTTLLLNRNKMAVYFDKHSENSLIKMYAEDWMLVFVAEEDKEKSYVELFPTLVSL